MTRDYLPGQIIAYPYLWSWQHERGENEGRKNRPTCVVVAVRGANDGLTHLALLAITTQPPQADRIALEVSAIECRWAGLGDFKQCWVIVDEYNYDIAERSWYIEPDNKNLGRFSKTFMMKIATAFGSARNSGRRVSRLDWPDVYLPWSLISTCDRFSKPYLQHIERPNTTMLRDAITMAALAHDGQTDKTGAPYIFHPLRVASTFSDEMLQVIAVLHDLVEDKDTTLSDLDARFPQAVVNAVEALTRRSEESYKEFIDRVARNPNARLVKIADIRDNLRPGAEHLRLRYEAALKVLEQG